MTLLTTVNDTCGMLGIAPFDTVVGNPNKTAQLLYAFANVTGTNLMQEYDWQVLIREYSFTTTAANEQPDAMPADWNRFLDQSMFNRTQMRQILGPIDPQQWQALKAVPATLLPWLAFRRRHDEYLLTSFATSGNLIAYEYVTETWVIGPDGEGKARYTADDDASLISEPLISLGIRWMYLERNGLDYAEPMRQYTNRKQSVASGDKGNPVLDAGGYGATSFNYPNIPLGNWPNWT